GAARCLQRHYVEATGTRFVEQLSWNHRREYRHVDLHRSQCRSDVEQHDLAATHVAVVGRDCDLRNAHRASASGEESSSASDLSRARACAYRAMAMTRAHWRVNSTSPRRQAQISVV